MAAITVEPASHTAFNFDFLLAPWLAARLRSVIDSTLTSHGAVGAPSTWVLGNHDVCRPASRYARDQHSVDPVGVNLRHFQALPAQPALGLRRACAAALLTLALPGGAYIYQGEELGLPEVEDLLAAVLQDPLWFQSGGTDPGRDGCRVPLPWASAAPGHGFGPADGSPPWLPQPASWADRSAEAQAGTPGSTLELYRAALRLRRDHPALGDGTLEWLDAGSDVLAFAREPGFQCWVNFSERPVALPEGAKVLVASEPLTASGDLPSDVAVWLSVQR